MIPSEGFWNWQLLARLVILGRAIPLLVACPLGLAFSGSSTNAQITPDNTLGAESSVVTPNVNINGLPSDQIDGGAKRGANLFHSFQEFNIEQGRGAYFTSPDGITNILSRVTGGNPSHILGTLGVRGGSANLFLINPNGIIFGPASSLNVGGSFVTTTANAIRFSEQGFFSASAPDVPPVLTVNPSAFLFNQITHGAIKNSSTAPAGLSATGATVLGLRVPDGQSLLLVGGDISIDGGRLNALGGRVELGGLSGLGSLGLEVNSHTLRLSFPSDLLSNVTLAHDARVGVRGLGGGDIVVNANAFTATDGGRLVAGTEGQANGGDITVNADDLTISGVGTSGNGAGLYNQVLANAVGGNGGNINVTVGSLSLMNGAQLNASTFGTGNAGNITIQARDAVFLDGVGSNRWSSTVLSRVEPGAKGDGGRINITTGSLSLTNGAQLLATTRGQGNAGTVTITARDTVSFDGVGSNGELSAVGSQVAESAVGKGGDINITARSLSVTNGAVLTADTFGRGDAGSVNINANDTVSLDGVGSNGLFSAVYSTVDSEAEGKGGDINITTGSLSVTNGAQLTAITSGSGDAGSITINARNTVSLDGERFSEFYDATFRSGASSGVFSGAEGKGGDINITAGSLSVTNGASLSANTEGEGEAGNIRVNAANSVMLSGVSLNGYSSELVTSTEQGAKGQGGEITVTTAAFDVADGANVNAQTRNDSQGGNVTINASTFEATTGGQVLTTTFSSGKAGNINLNITDSVTVSGSDSTYANRLAEFGDNVVNNEGPASGLFANAVEESTGQGGDLRIETGQLTVRDGAEVTVSSGGSGSAGKLEVTARSIQLDNQGKLTATSGFGKGGNITLQLQDLLLLQRNSQISAINGSISSIGLDGNINIDTNFLVVVPSQNSDIVATGFGRAPGSNIEVNARGIFGIQLREVLTSENDIVASGTVELNAPVVDPTQGLVNLPAELVDVSGLIAQTCPAGGGQEQSEFIVTGRGGLPPNSSEALSSEPVQVDWVTLNPIVETAKSPTVTRHLTALAPAPLVEAQGWVINNKGEVVLTATAPNVTPHIPWLTPASCQTPQKIL